MGKRTIQECDVCGEEIKTTVSTRTGRARNGEGAMVRWPSWPRRFARWLTSRAAKWSYFDRDGWRRAYVCDGCRRRIAKKAGDS